MITRLKTKPYDHQIECYEWAKEKNEIALFMEMGTGKSKTLIDICAMSYYKNRITGVIVVAPATILEQWRDEQLMRHMPEDTNYKAIVWDKESERFKKQCKFLMEHEGLSILLINSEALITERGSQFVRLFLENKLSMLAIDESTMIKNGSAKRTKLLIKLSKESVMRCIMTGSPGLPHELYNQFEFLRPGLLGYTSFVAYRNRYCEMKKIQVSGRIIETIAGFKNVDELQGKINNLAFRKLKSECLDLPEKIYLPPRFVEMRPAQKKYYNEMRDEMMSILNDKLVVVNITMVQILRLRQALCNLAPTGNENEAQQIETIDNRAEAVLEILQEAPKKVIIWANFVGSIKHLEKRIAQEYGAKFVASVWGSDKNSRNDALDGFKHGDIDYIVLNPKSCAKGHDLTVSSTSIQYDNDWSLEMRQQLEDRVHRSGQNKHPTYQDIVCPGTWDEKIINRLLAKEDIAQKVLGDDRRKLLLDLLN